MQHKTEDRNVHLVDFSAPPTYVVLIENFALYCLNWENTHRDAANVRRMCSLS